MSKSSHSYTYDIIIYYEHFREGKSVITPNWVITRVTPWSNPLLLAAFSFLLLSRFTVPQSTEAARTPSDLANPESHQDQVNALPPVLLTHGLGLGN